METALAKVENIMGRKFSDPTDPLLLSVPLRGEKESPMPAKDMMETVLNIRLTTKTIPGLIKRTRNERFVSDAYRRLLMMYADVVMEKAAGIEPEEEEGIPAQTGTGHGFGERKKGYHQDTDLTSDDLKTLCEKFETIIKEP